MYNGTILNHQLRRLHYIPLSQSYQEIYNIHAYFSGASPAMLKAAHSESVPFSSPDRLASEEDKQLRQIADAGREWKQSVGRKVDMEGRGSFLFPFFPIKKAR